MLNEIKYQAVRLSEKIENPNAQPVDNAWRVVLVSGTIFAVFMGWFLYALL